MYGHSFISYAIISLSYFAYRIPLLSETAIFNKPDDTGYVSVKGFSGLPAKLVYDLPERMKKGTLFV